jgi:hypothetical protein
MSKRVLLPHLPLPLLLLLLLCVTSCQPKTLTQDELWQGPLNYLQEGKTTRQEAILKLGEPSAAFEDGRILTYLIGQDAQGKVVPRRRQSLGEGVPQNATLANYSLVLVFDQKGILRKQSLVPAK